MGGGGDALCFVRLDPGRDGATVGIDLRRDGVLPIRQVIGIGRNYAAHAEEQGASVPERPLVFTKNAAACCLSGDEIPIPVECAERDQVDYEGELAMVIGRAARDLSEDEALGEGGPVLGYAVANDVSARWWQKQGSGGQFFRGKSFDGFCPVGPAVVPREAIDDPGSLTLETVLNGDRVQCARTDLMIFGVGALIAELSRGTTLLPGTLILTGTPAGVGMAADPPRYLRPGDEVRVSISGVGEIVNRFVATTLGN